MNSATHSATGVIAPESEADHWRRYGQLSGRFDQFLVANVDAIDIPNGCMLWVVPDDDAELAEWVIQRGTDDIRRGQSVYFHRVTTAALPSAPSDRGDPPGTRRIEYAADGSVQRVTVLGEDDAWHEVAPTREDAAGLPPRR